MALKYFFFVVIIGYAVAQTDPSISDAIASLPPELQGKVDEKQVEEIKNKTTQVFKEKCDKNGGPDAFPKAEKAFKGFTDCLRSLVDPTILKDEIENAKPNGQVDEVFKKYCEKTPKFKGCFRNVTDAVKPCFSAEERKNLNTVYNVSEQLAEFICFKEGDRIALFIAEDGPECLQEKQEEIQACVNQTVGANVHFDQNTFTADSLPRLEFGESECTKFSELQVCVVGALETCSAPTSANIVESLFKFVRKATPCRDHVEATESNARAGNNDKASVQPPNSANGLLVPTLMIAAAFVTAAM